MIPRAQIIGRLRDANYTFDRPGKHTEIYRRRGDTSDYVPIPKTRKKFTPEEASLILRQAGLTPDEIEDFLRVCVKE